MSSVQVTKNELQGLITLLNTLQKQNELSVVIKNAGVWDHYGNELGRVMYSNEGYVLEFQLWESE